MAPNPTQSTNHIMMMEPVEFHANPLTMATNSYQHQDDLDITSIQQKAVVEFRAFRDLLVEHGVIVTTTLGQVSCPDDIFCNNWVSTHAGKRMVLYPMLAKNRQTERRKDIIDTLRRSYTDVQDFTPHEQHGKALESTGAMCMDRVNRIAYQARSDRSNEELAAMWCKMNDYTHIPFDTEHMGKPVYHADVVMWIGTDIAGINSECLKKPDVLKHLQHRREVIEFTNEQMKHFCGNSLEVIGKGGERMLVMSAAGYETLREDQTELLSRYYRTIIKPEIPTIEYYGGGSARCMLLELF
ncbi:MAG TPA: arginine deiminase-related protein [Alphaproteobacteria bacterium]|nr:arginine deiminase-related protein [Alphaproteobacteria bacterium]